MDNLEYIQQNRVNILLKIIKLLVFVISMFSFIRFTQHNYLQATLDIVYVLIGIVCYYKLYNNPKSYTTIVRFLFFISILISIYLLSSLHDSPMRFLWIATVVYTIFYLFDKKEGIFWTLYIATLLLVLMIYNKNILAIEWIDFIILLTNMVVVTTIASWYAKVEKESTQRFIDAKNMLTKEVEIKTAQLQAKTKELQELNNNLEEKIAEKIQENRKHEEILFKQAKFAQIGEMINMIAHQWRQPLNAISTTNVSLMLKLQEEEHINRDDIINKLNRMSNYIQDLSNTIDDFRITYNETMKIDRANLHEIINNVIELFSNDLNYSSININKKFECKLMLEISRNELTQVLINIIKNSEEAFINNKIEEPIIDIETRCDDDFVYISICDNAGGIDDDIIDKIFDPYFTTKADLNGAGLGLYISKIIIHEKLQGEIWVKSENGYSTFYIKIPK